MSVVENRLCIQELCEVHYYESKKDAWERQSQTSAAASMRGDDERGGELVAGVFARVGRHGRLRGGQSGRLRGVYLLATGSTTPSQPATPPSTLPLVFPFSSKR